MTSAALVKATLDEADREANHRRYLVDPWAWICETVTTIDELDPIHPIKPFPVAACVSCQRYLGASESTRCGRCGGEAKPLGYLEHIARTWSHADPPILIVAKARRMVLSWLGCALHAWLAWTRPHSKVFIVSQKESKSAELLDRAEGILRRLPPDRCAPIQMHRTLAPPVLSLDNGASLYGIAEGADQLRQFTATGIMADELAHWNWPRAAFSAFKPCVDNGGRLLIVSSAAPGFFGELVRGEVLG
jgi:hypothetical protein